MSITSDDNDFDQTPPQEVTMTAARRFALAPLVSKNIAKHINNIYTIALIVHRPLYFFSMLLSYCFLQATFQKLG